MVARWEGYGMMGKKGGGGGDGPADDKLQDEGENDLFLGPPA